MAYINCSSAAGVGAFVSHIVVTKGLDFINQQKAKHEGKISPKLHSLPILKQHITISASKKVEEVVVVNAQS